MQAGLCLCVLALVGAVGTVYTFEPPQFAALTVSQETAAGSPRVYDPGKGGTRAVLPVNGVTFIVAGACERAGCELPPRLVALRGGQPITVWHEGTTAWQIAAATSSRTRIPKLYRPTEQNEIDSFATWQSSSLSECPCWFGQGGAVSSNPSIERTCQGPLRALWAAAHVER